MSQQQVFRPMQHENDFAYLRIIKALYIMTSVMTSVLVFKPYIYHHGLYGVCSACFLLIHSKMTTGAGPATILGAGGPPVHCLG